MWNFLRRLGAGFAEVWRHLSASARVNIALTLLATVALIVTVVLFGSRREFTVLYSGIENGEEVSQIQSILADEGVPYKLTDAGTTIKVPDSDVGRMRVALRAQGLPSRYGLGPGWELLDKQSIWVSPGTYETTKERAIQGELQRMLNQLEFVNRSFVYINHAKEGLFKKKQQSSEATVTLAVKRSPTKMEIETVVGIVSAFGGANLDRSHVLVATTDGQLLHNPTEDEAARVASSKHEVIEQWEQQREKRIREAFAELGRKAIVKVSAKLDFTAKEVVEDKVVEGVEFSTQETTTETTTTESVPQGAAGTVSNLPEGTSVSPGTQSIDKTNDTVTNNEPTRIRTKLVTEPGDPLQYKASVIIDWANKPALGADGKPTGEQNYGPPNAAEKEQFRQFVANAVGPEMKPEDVYVFDQPFQIEQIQEAQKTFASLEWANVLSTSLGWGGTLLKVALVLFGFWLVRRGLVKLVAAGPAQEEEAEPTVELPKASVDELRKREIATEVEELSQREPDGVAALLRAWMSESEE